MFAMTRIALAAMGSSVPFELVGASSSSNTSITLPAGSQAGDLVLVYVAKSNDSSRAAVTGAQVTSSGYTLLESATHNLVAQALYSKVLTGAETSVSMSIHTAGFALLFRGASPTILRSVQAETFGSINTPALTPTKSGALVITVGVSSVVNGTADVSAAPSGYGNTQIITDATGVGIWFSSLGLARKTWSSGTEDPTAWSYTRYETTYSLGYTIAVQPQ